MQEARALSGSMDIKQRLAFALLRMAQSLLSGHVVYFTVTTSPSLSKSVIKDGLLVGFKAADRILQAETKRSATEILFKKTHAWLFEKG